MIRRIQVARHLAHEQDDGHHHQGGCYHCGSRLICREGVAIMPRRRTKTRKKVPTVGEETSPILAGSLKSVIRSTLLFVASDGASVELLALKSLRTQHSCVMHGAETPAVRHCWMCCGCFVITSRSVDALADHARGPKPMKPQMIT